MRRLLFLALCVCFIAAGCDALSPSDFEPEIVVSGFLEAGERLPVVTLRHTVPLGTTLGPDSAAVEDADVRLELLTADGSVDTAYAYRTSRVRPGRYYPDAGRQPCCPIGEPRPDALVEPLRTYRLVVHVPRRTGPITAETTIPDTFAVTRVRDDTVSYQSAPPFTFDIYRPYYPGRQSVFVFTTAALEGFPEQLTPFAQSLLDSGSDITIGDLRERVSPILNEENFERQPDGSLRIRFPWLAIYFYGANRVIIQALDENMLDFVRSHMVQQGGSTRPPGEIPNVLDHVDGGRGVFGSYASASVDFIVTPQGQ